MSTDLKKYAVQSARYDGESPNRSFRSLRGSKGFNDKLKDAWWEGGNGFGWHLRLRLDHILYSDKLELVDVKVIDTDIDISDHKPLMASFRLN